MVRFPLVGRIRVTSKNPADFRIKKLVLSRATDTKKPAVPRLKVKPGETNAEKTKFAVGSREFHGRPPGLNDWQAKRLQTHQKLTGGLNTSFAHMLKQLSKPPDKRLKMAA